MYVCTQYITTHKQRTQTRNTGVPKASAAAVAAPTRTSRARAAEAPRRATARVTRRSRGRRVGTAWNEFIEWAMFGR